MQRTVRLPRDARAHRSHYEWWYTHGYLENEAGRRYGFMFCFVRFDAKTIVRFYPQFKVYPARTLYQLQLGLTDVTAQTHHYDEYNYLPWPGKVGASRLGLNVYFGHNHLRQIGPRRYDLRLQHHHRHLHLHLYDRKGPVLHGKNGILSFPGMGSTTYYSHTRLTAHGSFENASGDHFGMDGSRTKDKHEVEFVRGSAWIDHQWGDFEKDQPFSFWNWAGIQLDDGSEIMIYDPFVADGKPHNPKATWFGPKGERRVTRAVWRPRATWRSTKSGVTYPIDHEVELPDLGIKLRMTADVRDQEMFSSFFRYWEGACSVIGTKHGKRITGKSYVELTGYGELSTPGRKLRLGLKR